MSLIFDAHKIFVDPILNKLVDMATLRNDAVIKETSIGTYIKLLLTHRRHLSYGSYLFNRHP